MASTTASGVATANRAELIAIANSVASEKMIDKAIVIEAMEDAIQRAAKARYGAENDIRAKLDPNSGDLRLWRVVEVVEAGRRLFQAGRRQGRREAAEGRGDRRLYRRPAAPDRIRADRGAGRQAGDLPEGPRRRARAPVSRNSRIASARSSPASSSASNSATSSSIWAAPRASSAATRRSRAKSSASTTASAR